MNFKDGYFIDSIQSPIELIIQMTGRNTAILPYPMDSKDKLYYITNTGEVFFCKKIGEKYFIIKKNHMKRNSSEKKVKLSIGGNKEVLVNVSLCIYNAFVLGIWSDKPIYFKDGNKNNYELSNLTPYNIDITQENICRMYKSVDLYRSEFLNICTYISRNYNLSISDSEDIVQDAYIHVCINIIHGELLPTWIWYSKKRAIDFIYKKKKAYLLFEEQIYLGDKFEFPLYDLLKGKDKIVLYMYLNGYKSKEISNKLSISIGNVESRISRAKVKLKKFLKKDIEYYGRKRSL